MNPFKVNNVIKESINNGERISIDTLSVRCNGRIRHKFVRLSSDLFECEECGGFPRHWVVRVNLLGWLTLPFYNPEKNMPLPQVVRDKSNLEVAENISSVSEKQVNLM